MRQCWNRNAEGKRGGIGVYIETTVRGDQQIVDQLLSDRVEKR